MTRMLRIARAMRPAALLYFLALTASTAFAQDRFALRDGDRIVFYGDSITDQRRYTSFVETYVVTRFPKLNLTFTHSGWGGDRVTGGGGGPIDVRLWRDVLPYDPTVVTIMLGMNDGSYKAFDQAVYDTYTAGFQHIVEVLRKQLPGVRITAIQPSPYDDVTSPPKFEGGYNAVLLRFSDFLRGYAQAKNLDLCDFNTPVVEALTKANAIDPGAAVKLIPDRVHPGEPMTLVMAEALLKSWHAPSLVSDVEIDASRHAALAAKGTRVSYVHDDGGLSWAQDDDALPMPLDLEDPLTGLVLKSSDFTEALNREMLSVRGLAAGQYELRIDGEKVAAFTAAQLAAGINLAEYATPMSRQAAEVHAFTLRHTAIHQTRWRQLQVPLQTDQSPELIAALHSLDVLDAKLVAQQRAAAIPTAHQYQLVSAAAAQH